MKHGQFCELPLRELLFKSSCCCGSGGQLLSNFSCCSSLIIYIVWMGVTGGVLRKNNNKRGHSYDYTKPYSTKVESGPLGWFFFNESFVQDFFRQIKYKMFQQRTRPDDLTLLDLSTSTTEHASGLNITVYPEFPKFLIITSMLQKVFNACCVRSCVCQWKAFWAILGAGWNERDACSTVYRNDSTLLINNRWNPQSLWHMARFVQTTYRFDNNALSVFFFKV